MSVVIRLRREGTTKRPTYRVVVTDSRRPRDGTFIERLGLYYPRQKDNPIQINLERLQHWIKLGAAPSETVRSLVRRQTREAGKKAAA